jgi:CHAT domain-containing protein
MSLWKVPDKATNRLMKEFYTNYWLKKMGKAEALRTAQETVRDDPSREFSAPVNWAAWVLVGEGW